MSIPRPEPRANHHDSRAAELLAHEAASFIVQEAGPQSLITVTRALISSHGDRATIFVSIFPDDQIRPALAFLERQREEFSDHLKTHTRLKPLPRITFMLDDGEKNRQHLDELGKAL